MIALEDNEYPPDLSFRARSITRARNDKSGPQRGTALGGDFSGLSMVFGAAGPLLSLSPAWVSASARARASRQTDSPSSRPARTSANFSLFSPSVTSRRSTPVAAGTQA